VTVWAPRRTSPLEADGNESEEDEMAKQIDWYYHRNG
jgi:hypothetical protein